jgi:hypothetical protein
MAYAVKKVKNLEDFDNQMEAIKSSSRIRFKNFCMLGIIGSKINHGRSNENYKINKN